MCFAAANSVMRTKVEFAAEAFQINARPVNAFTRSKVGELTEAYGERSAPRSADVAVAEGKAARALP